MSSDALRFPWRFILGGVLVYLAIQALVAGIPEISSSQEARELQVIDTIRRGGSWILPLRNGLIPSKPPLYHWIVVGVSGILGDIGFLTPRLVPQICVALVLIMASLVAYRLAVTTRTVEGRDHAACSAILTAAIGSLTYGTYRLACQATVDMVFAACLWGALCSIALSDPARFRAEGRLPWLNRYIFWFWCAIGVLSRGPLGLVLPVLLVGIAGWCVVGFRRTCLEFMRPSFSWLVFLLPAAWYFFAYQLGEDRFLDRQIFFENIERFVGNEHMNSEAWWFYIPSFLRTSFPWGLLMLLFAGQSMLRPRALSYSRQRWVVRWLPSIVLLAGLVFFSCSSGKRHSYLVVLLPLVAIQVAVEVSSALEVGPVALRGRCLRAGRFVEVLLTSLVLASVVAFLLVSQGLFGPGWLIELAHIPLAAVGEAMAPVLIGATLATLCAGRIGIQVVFVRVWVAAIVLMTMVVAAGAAVKGHLKGFDAMSNAWLAVAGPQESLAVVKDPFDEYFDPIFYYFRRPVTVIATSNGVIPCERNTLYGARLSWMERHQDQLPFKVLQVAVLRERFASVRGDGSRDIVLYRCENEGPFRETPMQDAWLSDLSGKLG
jgi:4-amino-4-deoxy-L-arabinose transferase-like glycosyltransferase